MENKKYQKEHAPRTDWAAIHFIDTTRTQGHRVTVGDIYIYAAISWWSSGFFSNEINLQTLLGSTRPKLTSICHGVRAMPAVKAYYKDKNGPRDKLWAQFRIATTSPKSKL